jgi:hypothetical protein
MLPMSPDVVSVQPLPAYRLLLEFSNGERKIFDVTSYLTFGVFAQLNDPAVFSAVRVSQGIVEWPGELDLSPDTVYLTSVPADDVASSTAA